MQYECKFAAKRKIKAQQGACRSSSCRSMWMMWYSCFKACLKEASISRSIHVLASSRSLKNRLPWKPVFLASNMIFCKMVKNVRSLKFRLAALFRIKDFELPAQKTNFQLKIQASHKFKFQASVQNLGCQPKILASRRFRVAKNIWLTDREHTVDWPRTSG